MQDNQIKSDQTPHLNFIESINMHSLLPPPPTLPSFSHPILLPSPPPSYPPTPFLLLF